MSFRADWEVLSAYLTSDFDDACIFQIAVAILCSPHQTEKVGDSLTCFDFPLIITWVVKSGMELGVGWVFCCLGVVLCFCVVSLLLFAVGHFS